MGFTLSELKIIEAMIEDHYDCQYQTESMAKRILEARSLIKREIKLKQLNPIGKKENDEACSKETHLP